MWNFQVLVGSSASHGRLGEGDEHEHAGRRHAVRVSARKA